MDEGPWFCWRCRAEKTFPHPWCGTASCCCDECLMPNAVDLADDIRRRWPDRFQVVPLLVPAIQLDLLSAVLRAGQLAKLDWFDSSHWLWRMFAGCDLPRLTGHLSPDVAEWASQQLAELGLHRTD